MVEIEIELSEDKLFTLMLIAHEQDITLNQLCNNILRQEIKRLNDSLNKGNRKRQRS